MSPSQLRVAVMALAVLMLVGGLGTWDSEPGTSVNGLEIDGVVVIAAAALAALAALVTSHRPAMAAMVVAVISTAVCIYDWQDVQGTSGHTVGWGLWLSMIASALAIPATIALLRTRDDVTGPA